MTAPRTRRSVLQAGLAGALCLPLAALASRTGFAATPQAARVRPIALADRLFLFQGAGGNVVAGGADDGLLMVDGGLVEHSAQLIESIRASLGEQPVRTLLNTHWHWNHTGSNERLAEAGATLIAHENTRLWLSTDVVCQWEHRTYPRRPQSALPTRTFFYDIRTLSSGGQSVEYGYLPQAHTDGDIYVFFPEHNVLVAGDVASGGSYPLFDYSTGGWIGGMMDGLKILIEKSDAQTRIVPGCGPLRSRADLQAQLELCTTLTSRIYESYYKGQTWDELVAARATREFDERWGDPALFLRTAYESVWGHITEFPRFRS